MIPSSTSSGPTTGTPEIRYRPHNSSTSAIVASGPQVTGLVIMPASDRLTTSTCLAWSSTDMLRCSTPMPPCRAMATAMVASVTVSIADDSSGARSIMPPRVSRVVVSASLGSNRECAGSSSTSSKVSAGGPNLASWVMSVHPNVMLDGVISFLRCPQCADGGALTRALQTLRCPAGHAFDIARSGYVSLLPAGPARNAGDTSAMVAARQEFLASGHFAGLAATLAAMAAASETGACETGGCVVDVGAGTGYYLAAVLDRLPGRAGLALDISKSALKLAARAHPRAASIGC